METFYTLLSFIGAAWVGYAVRERIQQERDRRHVGRAPDSPVYTATRHDPAPFDAATGSTPGSQEELLRELRCGRTVRSIDPRGA